MTERGSEPKRLSRGMKSEWKVKEKNRKKENMHGTFTDLYDSEIHESHRSSKGFLKSSTINYLSGVGWGIAYTPLFCVYTQKYILITADPSSQRH